MNKRIKELAEQSLCIKGGEFAFNGGDVELVDLKKFAQLIVRECLEACSRANEIRHFVPPTQEQVVLSCMREIETTFRS